MQNELNEYYINLLREKYRAANKAKKSEYLDEAEAFTKDHHQKAWPDI